MFIFKLNWVYNMKITWKIESGSSIISPLTMDVVLNDWPRVIVLSTWTKPEQSKL